MTTDVDDARAASITSTPFSPVLSELDGVEGRLNAVSDVDHPILGQTLRLILGPGGKRLRPALVLLTSGFNGTPLDRRERLAVAAELLHTATLVHDDILDESAARRGRATVNTVFGNSLAVLTGDYLFAKAAEFVASLDSPAIMGIFAWAVMELCQGEMLPLSLNGDPASERTSGVTEQLHRLEDTYLAKVRSKTASLLAMCCQTGAMLDGADEAVVSCMRQYGLELGVAFQIIDDILDLTSTEEALGKPVGSDLLQGTMTLPIIYFLEAQPQHPLVDILMTDGMPTDEYRVRQFVAEIRESEAIDRARVVALRFGDAATRCLEGLPASQHGTALAELVRYALSRQS